MKKIIQYIIPILVVGFIISCDEEGLEKQKVELQQNAVLHSVESADLNPNTPTNPALTLVWDDADYGANVQINYAIQASSEESFENFTEITTLTERSYAYNVTNLNVWAVNLGLTPNQVGTLYFRIKSSVGSPETLVGYSNVIGVDMTPYVTYTFKDFYLVGNGAAAGWNPDNNNTPMFRSPDNENFYSFTGFFANGNPADYNEGRFKLLEDLGNWQPQWGDSRDEGSDDPATSGMLAGNPATQDYDPGRFGVTTEGYYTFTANFADNTYTISAFDASGLPTYETIGVIGSATAGGWDSDQDMTKSEFDPHIWYVNGIEIGNGELKFRADNAWDVNWGSDTAYSGTATADGPNVPVTSGNYDIWFNDLTGEYMLIPQE